MPIEPPPDHGKILEALRAVESQLRDSATASPRDPLVAVALGSVTVALVAVTALVSLEKSAG